jgi:hypothetical protein
MEYVAGAVVVTAVAVAAVLWYRSRSGLRMAKQFESVNAATAAPLHPDERALLERGMAAAIVDLSDMSSGVIENTADGPSEDEVAVWRDLYNRLHGLPDGLLLADVRHRANWQFRIARVGTAYVVLKTRRMHGYSPWRIVCSGAAQPVLVARTPLGTPMSNELAQDASTVEMGRLSIEECAELTDLLAGVYKVGS